MKPKDIFNKISYLQYPLVIVSLYYYALFIISLVQRNIAWGELNNVLVFFGLAISISTLQDTTKSQNKLSTKIWQSPTKGKIFLVLISIMTILLISIGLLGFLSSSENVHKEISFGLIVLGIGLVGMLKAAIEMFENHRIDKNPTGFNAQ